jgi:hypothetical protein
MFLWCYGGGPGNGWPDSSETLNFPERGAGIRVSVIRGAGKSLTHFSSHTDKIREPGLLPPSV